MNKPLVLGNIEGSLYLLCQPGQHVGIGHANGKFFFKLVNFVNKEVFSRINNYNGASISPEDLWHQRLEHLPLYKLKDLSLSPN